MSKCLSFKKQLHPTDFAQQKKIPYHSCMVYLHIFTYIWLISMVNVGKYTIHGPYGYGWRVGFSGILPHENRPYQKSSNHPFSSHLKLSLIVILGTQERGSGQAAGSMLRIPTMSKSTVSSRKLSTERCSS